MINYYFHIDNFEIIITWFVRPCCYRPVLKVKNPNLRISSEMLSLDPHSLPPSLSSLCDEQLLNNILLEFAIRINLAAYTYYNMLYDLVCCIQHVVRSRLLYTTFDINLLLYYFFLSRNSTVEGN